MNGAKRLFLSWNVNGIRAAAKKGFVDFVLGSGADLVAIQEMKARPEQLGADLLNIPGYEAFWFPAARPGYAGVCTYSRIKPLVVSRGMDREEFDREGRVLTLEFDDFFLVNAYFPNAQPELARIDYKIAFNRAIHAFLDRLAEKKSVVVGGDFNVAHRPLDLANPKANEKNPGYSEQERAWMDDFINDGYVDTFRMFNREPEQYTWWSYRAAARERNIGWRIDYFCVDAATSGRVQAAGILPQVQGSDHCPVSLLFC